MIKKTPKETQLKVMEALQEEAYKGIVRIDLQTMKEIGIRPGDIVEIEGKRKTVGIADRAYPTDVGEAVIRMDGILRRNAKTGIGEVVKVRKAEVKEAKKILIAPAQQGIMIQANPAVFKNGLLGRVVVKGDIISLGGSRRRRTTMEGSPFEDIFDMLMSDSGFMGSMGSLKFVVADANPKEAVIISENTEIQVSQKAVAVSEDTSTVPDVTYEDIGGLEEEVKRVREMVELPMRHPELFQKLGINPPRGVLLHGPPGTGKTLLARAVANESDVTFIEFKKDQIIGALAGSTEKNIANLFSKAKEQSPAIIFIDEVDSFAMKRESRGVNEFLNTPVAELLKHMDGLSNRGDVVVIAATNRPEVIDPALRRPGRFDREIEFGTPNMKARLEILKIHTRNMPLTKDVNLKELASITHGFVGADLEALAKEAAMSVLRKILPELNLKEDTKISKETLEKIKITQEDFKEALKMVRPSAMREILVETPNTKWEDIGGLDKIKQELVEAVEWPLKHSDSFKRMGVRPPKGVLLYGPPGTGKTLLAKAVATESEANFIQVKGSEIISKWVGESAKGIKKVFEKARQVSPAIIFFDEIDAIAGRRGQSLGGSQEAERVVNQLLIEMDGLMELKDVVVIGATNRPDMMDPALLRPGRFDRLLLTSIPDKKARMEIFKIHTKGMPLAKDVSLIKLTEKTPNYVGTDIESVCREAAMLALRKDLNAKEVTMEHFEAALKKITSSITEKDIEKYKQIESQYIRTARGAAIREANYFG